MNGLKEALEYIVGLGKPELVKIGGETYSDKQISRVSFNPKARAVKMSTLGSLLDYLKANVDGLDMKKMIIHVQSPTEVSLYSCLDPERERENLVEVEAQVPGFRYGEYMGHETFLIALQSKFLQNGDRDLLLKFAGTVERGSVAEYGDDGVSQKATVRTGISSRTSAIVPNPVTLIPYRTFLEAGQPESCFIFRMKEDDRAGVSCAIFEADGGAWKIKAMENVRNYLVSALADLGIRDITVLC